MGERLGRFGVKVTQMPVIRSLARRLLIHSSTYYQEHHRQEFEASKAATVQATINSLSQISPHKVKISLVPSNELGEDAEANTIYFELGNSSISGGFDHSVAKLLVRYSPNDHIVSIGRVERVNGVLSFDGVYPPVILAQDGGFLSIREHGRQFAIGATEEDRRAQKVADEQALYIARTLDLLLREKITDFPELTELRMVLQRLAYPNIEDIPEVQYARRRLAQMSIDRIRAPKK